MSTPILEQSRVSLALRHSPIPALRKLSVEESEAAVVIRGAMVYDGSGQPGQKGDLAIRGEHIVAVGSFTVGGQPRIIDGNGLIVAPGFIDLHTHSDYPLQQAATRANLNYLMQGVTTVVTGNCGSGPIDVAAFFKALEAGGIGGMQLAEGVGVHDGNGGGGGLRVGGGGGEAGLGVLEFGLVVARVNLYQHLSRFHRLVVVHKNLCHAPIDFRSHRGDVPIHLCVV